MFWNFSPSNLLVWNRTYASIVSFIRSLRVSDDIGGYYVHRRNYVASCDGRKKGNTHSPLSLIRFDGVEKNGKWMRLFIHFSITTTCARGPTGRGTGAAQAVPCATDKLVNRLRDSVEWTVRVHSASFGGHSQWCARALCGGRTISNHNQSCDKGMELIYYWQHKNKWAKAFVGEGSRWMGICLADTRHEMGQIRDEWPNTKSWSS